MSQYSEECHSPFSDQPFLQASSYPPFSPLWAPETHPMGIDQVHSNPPTPEGYDGQSHSDLVPLGVTDAPVGYLHSKRPSCSPSMGGSPRHCLDDRSQFISAGANQASQSHPVPRQDPLHLSEQHHYARAYSGSGVPQVTGHSQPHMCGAPMPNQNGPSILHHETPAFAHTSGPSVFFDGNPDQMQRSREENPAPYNKAYNNMVPAPTPSPMYPSNWMPLNNSAYVQPQSASARPSPPFVPIELMNPAAMQVFLSNLSLAELLHVCNHLPYHVLVQQEVAFRQRAHERAAAYRMNQMTGHMPYNGPKPSGATPPAPDRSATGTHTRLPSQSDMSTPSLSAHSPTGMWSPPPEGPNHAPRPNDGYVDYPTPTVSPTPTPPRLVEDVVPSNPKRGPKKPKPSACPKPSGPRRHSVDNQSISPWASESPVLSVSVTPSSVAAIPLRIRVSTLPKDKRVMFERAAGDRWNPKSPKEDHEEGLDRAEARLLEDLYALIGSEELRIQSEIPDDLVEPILKTKLLPKADAHKGSRGGAAGHICLWAGCGKEIKRLDHSRNHIREHCKSKPHTCGANDRTVLRGCSQTFLRVDDLKRHQKSHCSVLRSGPGRRPRANRGVRHRDTDEEEEHSEDSISMNGGDDDDYRPVHMRSVSSASSCTRELASRLRRQRTSRFVADESTSESDSNNTGGDFGRLQTSNVRRAVESPAEHHPRGGDEDGVGEWMGMENMKVWLAYGTLMASCSLQLITVPIGPASYFFSIWLLLLLWGDAVVEGMGGADAASWFVGEDRAVRLFE